MELQLFGINHKTSKVSERERFIINDTNQILLLSHLKKIFKDDIESFFGISTCNRTELYFVGKKDISKNVLNETLKALQVNNISVDCSIINLISWSPLSFATNALLGSC